MQKEDSKNEFDGKYFSAPGDIDRTLTPMETRANMRFASSFMHSCRLCTVLLLLILLGAQNASAEGGELAISFSSGHEAARLVHPSNGFDRSPVGWAYIPRLGLYAQYGVSHTWHVGLGAEYAFVREMSFSPVARVGSGEGELLSSMQSIFIPGTISYHVTQGGDWSYIFSASVGPLLMRWDDKTIYRAGSRGTSQPQRLPLNTKPSWEGRWGGRAETLVQWRPTPLFSAIAGPYITASTEGELAFGAILQAQMQWGVGPYF